MSSQDHLVPSPYITLQEIFTWVHRSKSRFLGIEAVSVTSKCPQDVEVGAVDIYIDEELCGAMQLVHNWIHNTQGGYLYSKVDMMLAQENK